MVVGIGRRKVPGKVLRLERNGKAQVREGRLEDERCCVAVKTFSTSWSETRRDCTRGGGQEEIIRRGWCSTAAERRRLPFQRWCGK